MDVFMISYYVVVVIIWVILIKGNIITPETNVIVLGILNILTSLVVISQSNWQKGILILLIGVVYLAIGIINTNNRSWSVFIHIIVSLILSFVWYRYILNGATSLQIIIVQCCTVIIALLLQNLHIVRTDNIIIWRAIAMMLISIFHQAFNNETSDEAEIVGLLRICLILGLASMCILYVYQKMLHSVPIIISDLLASLIETTMSLILASTVIGIIIYKKRTV